MAVTEMVMVDLHELYYTCSRKPVIHKVMVRLSLRICNSLCQESAPLFFYFPMVLIGSGPFHGIPNSDFCGAALPGACFIILFNPEAHY